MTAYARARSQEALKAAWTVELHSVNRKGLDILVSSPPSLLFLDIEMRKIIGRSIHRGKVSVKISYSNMKEEAFSITALKKQMRKYTKIAKELHLSTDEITLPFLLKQQDLDDETFSTKEIQQLKETLNDALKTLLKMKETEGKALHADISKRLKTLSGLIDAIETESENSVATYREKLTQKLAEILERALEDERILREVALFAEKADITEEITRFRSHIQQFQSKGKEESVGKTLEFLTQEMLREINTISAKSPALSVVKKAIEIKAELEKIREQVQNIE